MKMTTHDAAAGGDPGVGLALEWAIQAEDHAKARWRAFCAAFWGWMQLALRAAPPRACPFPGLAVVLVEFRAECVTSACFVILQALRQLGRVPVHVVCGPANQDALEARLRPLEAWSGGLRLHALPEARRADVGFYTRLLLSAGFWERFPQDRLLVMQEDSCLFHGRLGPFLKYDYVGAPWAHRENRHDVGNGGFSLRSRQAMLRVLHALQGDFSNIMSPHAQRHWRGSAQYPPEDVVFANTLLRHPRLGTVAPRAAALYFSQELVPSPPTVLGGHTWWLHTLRTRRTSYSLLGVLCRLFPVAVVASPYTYSMGGGEKYLSHLLHALTSAPGGRALFPLVCSVSDTSQVRDTLRRLQLPGAWADRVRVCPWDHLRAYCRDLPHPLWRPHTLVHMHNASVPAVPAVGRARNWLHCQFPFDLDQPPGARASQARDLAAYHKIIVNSPFTAAHLRRRYGQMGAPPAVSKRIEVVYPPCVDRAALPRAPRPSAGSKVPRSCVMVGRLAPPSPMGNNKCHHVAVRAFNALHKMGETAPSLTIVGACTDTEWEAELRRRIRSPRITLVVNASEKQKNACLRRAQTLLHLTGMEDTRPQNEEHFGIVLIEAMAAGCAPLCYRGGFPGQWLPDTHLVDSEEALVRRLRHPAPPPPLQRDLTPFTHQAFAAAVRRLMLL